MRRITFQLLLPGSKLAARAEDDRIPITLIQRALQCQTLSSDSAASNPTVSGWTVLVPAGWGSAFWHSLVYADTRIAGLRERSQQYYEAGVANFPQDYPCTKAFNREVKAKAEVDEARWLRRPPAKRVNYTKLRIPSPWSPDFEKVGRTYDTEIVGQPILEPEPRLVSASKPWLASGALIKRYIDKLQTKADWRKGTMLVAEMHRSLLEVVEYDLLKRGLKKLHHATAKRLLHRAFVRVALKPIKRGTPKYNAVIYVPNPEVAGKIREDIAIGKNPALLNSGTNKRKLGDMSEAEAAPVDIDEESGEEEETDNGSDSDENVSPVEQGVPGPPS